MKKLLLYISPFCLLAISACKKNSLPPNNAVPGSPVFYLNCNVNSVPVNFQAGVNDYYMYSSFSQQLNNVYQYKADLKKKSCTSNCGYALSVIINDFKVSAPGATMNPDSGLVLGKYEFNDGNLPPLGYNGTFTPLTTSFNGPFSWTYNNGLTIETNTSTTSAYHTFNSNQTYSVSCKTLGSLSTPAHTNVFRVGHPLQANINVQRTGMDPTFSYTAIPTVSVSNYYWDYGDGEHSVPTSQYSYTSHNFPPTIPAYYTTALTLRNATDTCYSYYQIPAFPGTSTPHANFTSSFAPILNTNALSAVTILLTDASGTQYSSGTFNQTGNSFEIVSVQDYKVNETGQKTKQVKIKFNCTVTNGSSSIKIDNGEAVIAVSYK